jgi:hypothetical protein
LPTSQIVIQGGGSVLSLCSGLRPAALAMALVLALVLVLVLALVLVLG